MKKLKYFFASAIVLVAVAVSTIVFAEYKEQKGDIRFGNTISNNSITVTEGNLVEQGDIQINKTVSKIDDNGNYKVTFEVKGKDVETHTSNKKDVYAVVVLDKSNSMCNSYNCFRDEKWRSAVNGAKTFAKTLHEKLPNAKIALVTFADKNGFFGDKAYNDAEVLRNFAKADFSNVNFGTPNGGTNLQAGLYEANELLTASNVKKDSIKYVVVISDGEPTLYYDDNGYTDGPGSYMDATTEAKTKEMAKTVQKSAEVFAIGYDYNGTILSEVASGADHVYLSDPKTIVTKFTDIATIMGKANAGTDATLTDNIGAKFVMTDAQGNKYTSEKFDITEAGKTFSFNIKINEEDITEDGWYSTNADFELTYTDPKGNTKTIHSNKNPEVYWVAKRYDYKIEYYYDRQIDNTLTETGKNVKGKEITVSDESIKNNTKTGYKLKNVDPENKMIYISSNEEENIIRVHYVKDETQTKDLYYTVEYYKDGVKVTEDTQTVKDTVQVLKPDTLTVDKSNINTKDKYVGYKFEKTNPTEIPDTIEHKSIIKVYYVKGTYKYTVNYYYDNVIDKDSTDTFEAKYQDVITTYEQKVKTGYVLDKVTGLDLTISEDESKNVINVYYKKAKYSYVVEYYYDNVLDGTKTDTFKATYNEVIKIYEDKVKTGYVLDKVDGTPLTITEITTNNTIKVYYKKASYTYEVRYYFNRELDESLTEKGTALFGDKITSYTDKVKEDYTLETVENLPLVISEDESKNIINVYYKIDGQGVIEPIEPIEPPHTSANNSIYALILLVNALGASVLLKKREN